MATEQADRDKRCSRCGRGIARQARVCPYCGALHQTASEEPSAVEPSAAPSTAAEHAVHAQPSAGKPFEVTGPSLPISSAYGGTTSDRLPLSTAPAPTYDLAPGGVLPSAPAETPKFRNAPFWPRLAAFMIDRLILAIPFGMLVAAALLLLGAELDIESERFMTIMQLAQLPLALLEITYFTLMNGTYGATLGKMAVGLRIVRADGASIGYGVALGRAVMQLLLQNCTCSLFYLSVAINAEHRGWHDQIAGTRVIYVR